jgi:hypothetical protein
MLTSTITRPEANKKKRKRDSKTAGTPESGTDSGTSYHFRGVSIRLNVARMQAMYPFQRSASWKARLASRQHLSPVSSESHRSRCRSLALSPNPHLRRPLLPPPLLTSPSSSKSTVSLKSALLALCPCACQTQIDCDLLVETRTCPCTTRTTPTRCRG